MLAVIDLDGIETLRHEAANPLVVFEERGMGQRADALGVVDTRDDFRGRGACPRNERRPALGQPAIEGLVGVRHMPTRNQRTRDPWAPGRLSRIVDGRPQDRFDIQRDAERGEPGRHLAQAVDALMALLRQKRGQVRGGQLDEVPEHVYVDDRLARP